MKLDRLVVRLSALALAAVLALPFVVDRVQAFGNAADAEPAFPPQTESTEDTVAPVDDFRIEALAPTPTTTPPPRTVAAPAPTPEEPSSAADSNAPEAFVRSVSAAPSGSGSATVAEDPEETEVPVQDNPPIVFDGVVAKKNTKRAPKWTSFVVTPEASGNHVFSLQWTGKGNLMLSVRDRATNAWLGSDTSKDRPKTITVHLKANKEYRLAVWAKQGKGTFTVTMSQQTAVGGGSNPSQPPRNDPPPSDPPPSDPPPPEQPPTPPPGPSGNGYPGEPPNGTLVWGASITGNGDPVSRHEQPSGHALTLRRTFWQWSQRTGSMINTAKGDLAAGRLPWVSVKTPGWQAMANGKHNSEIDSMLRALDALNGPVWLTIHHEPEGGGGRNVPDDPGGPSAHVAMNKQVRARMTALATDNISLAPILMTYSWTKYSKRNPDEWWAPGIYDFLGVDHYRDAETSMLTSTWFEVRQWAAARGVDVAVGEWGMRGSDNAAGQRVHEWYDHAVGSYRDGRGARVIGLSAFDSSLNTRTGSWVLKGKQLEAFHDLLNDPRTAGPR
jgi:hypothetical protein